MTSKIRRTGLLRRPEQHRDARLYVVATEDTYAPAQYFHALQERELIDRSRVRVITLATEDCHSAPGHLLKRLDEYRVSLDAMLKEDELWAVFDVDHHRDKELSAVVTAAGQKGYRLAVSNPCFEIWLLLHETDDVSAVVTYKDDSEAAQRCVAELRRVLGGSYNKSRIDAERLTHSSVNAAITRAARMENPAERWPARVGTHVHRLVQRLLRPGA